MYVFNLGDGADTINEVEVYGQPTAQADTLRFGVGIDPADVAASRQGTSLQLKHRNGTDSVTVTNWYTAPGATPNQIERVEFADGTVWTSSTLTDEGLAVVGTNDADSLTGLSNYANILQGNWGADVIAGGAEADTFIFGWGDSADILYEYGGTDEIRFKDGIEASDVSLKRAGNDLIIGLGHGEDSITVKGWYTGAANQIEQFRFADGTSLSPNSFAVLPT
jgi:hypothetical protein